MSGGSISVTSLHSNVKDEQLHILIRNLRSLLPEENDIPQSDTLHQDIVDSSIAMLFQPPKIRSMQQEVVVT